jgi:tetraprenyl-beta-curcumene synthase
MCGAGCPLRASVRDRAGRRGGAMFGDRRCAGRAVVALALANARYWPSVAPLVRSQLRHWDERASAIPDPVLRDLAVGKLRDEHFNAEVAATLATIASKQHRADAVKAIVALEVTYDYLDGLTERPNPDPLRSGERLYGALGDGVALQRTSVVDYYEQQPHREDGGYLQELSSSVRESVRQLPGAGAIGDVAARSTARCAQAQVRVHAASQLGTPQLEEWARRKAAGSALGWREYLAGAVASVLAVHALIAAGADEDATEEDAAATDEAYLSISALSTMLDSLIDYEHDLSDGEPWYLSSYENRGAIADRLAEVAEQAVEQVRGLPHSAHHLMTLVGVVAYYTSAPEARSEASRPVIARLHRELQPLITPTLAVMLAWRGAKRIHARRRDEPAAYNSAAR